MSLSSLRFFSFTYVFAFRAWLTLRQVFWKGKNWLQRMSTNLMLSAGFRSLFAELRKCLSPASGSFPLLMSLLSEFGWPFGRCSGKERTDCKRCRPIWCSVRDLGSICGTTQVSLSSLRFFSFTYIFAFRAWLTLWQVFWKGKNWLQRMSTNLMLSALFRSIFAELRKCLSPASGSLPLFTSLLSELGWPFGRC